MTTVMTGWHPAGYDLYGRNFVETFARHWPGSVGLLAYVEEPRELPRGTCRNLWDCDGVWEFVAAHKDTALYCGREPTERWKDRDRRLAYNFRFDAVKFCRQGFIPEHAIASLEDGDVLAWLDADVVTFADVPDGFVETLLADADLVYLGREPKHSELGFWAVRVNARTREFVGDFAHAYRSGRVFDMNEWHSAYVFDRVRVSHERVFALRSRNLTPGGSGHVWFQCPLGKYTDHLKGPRKHAGRSAERAA